MRKKSTRNIITPHPVKPRVLAWVAGFTLIELMIVVIIIGVLASLVLPKYSRSRERTIDKQAQSILGMIRAAEREYYMKRGRYFPTSGSTTSVDAINGNLSLDLLDDGVWNYTLRSNNGFNATLTRNKGGYSRNWQINSSQYQGSCFNNCP